MNETPLGQSVAYPAAYDPSLLCPIERAPARALLGIGSALPFFGWDIWNAYELSWLDLDGKPQVAIGECRIPVSSPCIVESKSFKLYLNSLNLQRFADADTVRATVVRDLAACVGAEVKLQIHLPGQWHLVQPLQPEGECLDMLPVSIHTYTPDAALLRADPQRSVSQRYFTRLLRSCCPVTGQPDWGTVMIEYDGPAIDPAGLLAYIVSFREHQDFHEHCVERMFIDISARCRPQRLAIHARYLRRGGLDINPYRSTSSEIPANTRLTQQ